MECKSNCYCSNLGYCIKGDIKMMPLLITGPNGSNEYGMRCADYAVLDKPEDKT